MQNMLQNLLGGQERQQYQDFVDRYEQGPPSEGYANQEVTDRYQQVASRLSPEMYQASAAEALARLSPQERQSFGQALRDRATQQNMGLSSFNKSDFDDQAQRDPNFLAQVMGQMQQEQPNAIGQMLGGRGGELLDNPMVKGALAGVAAHAVKRFMGGRQAA
jgi:hypothetical protein